MTVVVSAHSDDCTSYGESVGKHLFSFLKDRSETSTGNLPHDDDDDDDGCEEQQIRGSAVDSPVTSLSYQICLDLIEVTVCKLQTSKTPQNTPCPLLTHA